MSHLKSLKAPKTWRVPKKATKFTAKPNPGAHSLELGMPLVTALKRIGLARNQREADYILKNKELMVDGKRRHDRRHSVGFMDVVSIPKAKEYYRMIMTSKGLEPREVSDKDAKAKPVKITGKTSIKGGKTQINTLDGRSIVLDKDGHSVGDTLLIEIPSQKIKDSFKLKKGAKILLYKGKHAGETANVENIDGKTISFKKDGEVFETKREYAFVLGKDKTVIEHYE